MASDVIKNKDSNIQYRYLKAVDIKPKDDTFHGNINLIDIEWWYFDAVFDNGYSAHVGVRTYHLRNSGFVQTRINIYKNGKVESGKVKTYLLSDFHYEIVNPSISIKKNPIITFDKELYSNKNIWQYNINLKIENIEVNLIFTSTSKGWKIETLDTSWTTPAPKAKVEGFLILNDKKIQVKGVGYHDHNWDYSPITSLKNNGWYWGRITSDTFNITWANILKTKSKGDLITVINQDYGNYFNINPEKIVFTYSNFIKNRHRKIPTDFKLRIKDSETQNNIVADIDMNTIDIQHSKIFTIHYWRYHVNTSGFISIGQKTEKLDNKKQIIEYLCFKS